MATIESIAETLQDWMYEEFDKPTIQRGLRVFGAGLIQRVDIERAYITSAVRSERLTKTVYLQRIELDGDLVFSQCSCPVGMDCKHVAAVILAIMDQAQSSSMAGFQEFGTKKPTPIHTKPALVPEQSLPPPDPKESPLLRTMVEKRTILDPAKGSSLNNAKGGRRPDMSAGYTQQRPAWEAYGQPADLARWNQIGRAHV